MTTELRHYLQISLTIREKGFKVSVHRKKNNADVHVFYSFQNSLERIVTIA